MFEDKQPDDVKPPVINEQTEQATADEVDQEKPADSDNKAEKVFTDGGIVVSQNRQVDKLKTQVAKEKRTSNVTEVKKSEKKDTGRESKQEMLVRELSETTANPSNLGNFSNIRDPRYSQEMQN